MDHEISAFIAVHAAAGGSLAPHHLAQAMNTAGFDRDAIVRAITEISPLIEPACHDQSLICPDDSSCPAIVLERCRGLHIER